MNMQTGRTLPINYLRKKEDPFLGKLFLLSEVLTANEVELKYFRMFSNEQQREPLNINILLRTCKSAVGMEVVR